MEKLTQTYQVEEKHLALAVGSGDMPVLGTPCLVAFMENCAMRLAQTLLNEGESSVGTQISTSHLHPTPMGGKVEVEARLVERDSRRLIFEITASDEAGVVAECKHERFVVARQRFLEKIGL